MKPNTSNVVIYHKNCIDGFAGLTVAYIARLFSNKDQIMADVPSATDAPDIVKGKSVIIIDVAYSYAVIQKICALAKSVLFIDHHLGTEAMLKEKLPSNLKVIYNVNYSGSLNAWKYFFPKSKMPLALLYINDNDIGKWEEKYTMPFITGCEVLMSFSASIDNIHKWKALLTNSALVKKIIKRGMVYEEYKNNLIRESRDRAVVVNFPGKAVKHLITGSYRVAVLNGNCPSTSAVATAVLESVECDFVMIWNLSLRDNAYYISFRSKTTDVNEIAKALGGGGHKYASACKIPASSMNIYDVFTE